MFYVYVLQNIADETDYYLGYSSDLVARLKSHNEGKNKSTKNKQWRVVYYEAYISEAIARQREYKLKRNPRMKRFLMDRIKSQIQSG